MRQLAVAALMLAVAGLARADDKPNPTGTWKYTINVGGQDREITLKLKQDGDKLTGAMVRGDMETKIEDGKYKDGAVSFQVTRERDGQKFVIKYSGKVSGDTLKGKMEFEINGEAQSREFEAKRAKDS